MFKLDNFGVILFVSFSYKKLLQCSFYENFKKIDAKIDFSVKNSKKFVYYNEMHEQFQTQLSQKLQRFKTCRKNKKCSIFYNFSEYIIFSYGCKLLDWPFKWQAWHSDDKSDRICHLSQLFVPFGVTNMIHVIFVNLT